MDVPKSPTPVTDPIQSLVQQLTSMANTQHQKISAPTKPEVISPWGQSAPVNAVQSQAPNQWGTSHPNTVPWEYREQMAKLVRNLDKRKCLNQESTYINSCFSNKMKRFAVEKMRKIQKGKDWMMTNAIE
jgi:soluble cytochrome b562